MNIRATLSEVLLKQPFTSDENEWALLEKYKQVAQTYSIIENSLAVLSDLRSNQSYIYYGGVGETLGIASGYTTENINSICEDDIFSRIHPEDLIRKHLYELRFFQLLKLLPVEERSDYQVLSKLRMKDKSGDYILIHHRMFYVSNCSPENLWLALCLYNFSQDTFPVGMNNSLIINSATGKIVDTDPDSCKTILSTREKEILFLIQKGYRSKDIAEKLSISKNTVSRHRQNILEKLCVKNSFEACRVGKLVGFI
ncbi:MAG: LuxR C-terminal-related transcriptional regulator [Tannerellaceae bacterium]|nr:LuxR C-terminal-related transcriptional regulator [Tannerellaceae bacterium]